MKSKLIDLQKSAFRVYLKKFFGIHSEACWGIGVVYMFLGAMHLTTKWPAQRKFLKNPRSRLTFLINRNPSFSRRQAFVYGSSTGFYSDSSSAAVAAAQTAAAAQHQGNLFWGVDKTTVRRFFAIFGIFFTMDNFFDNLFYVFELK